MRLFGGRGDNDRQLTWQACSVLLGYPDEHQAGRLDLVTAALPELVAARRRMLSGVVHHLRSTPLAQAQEEYVETFDWQRRRTLYLTYWTAGDTRNRGMALLRFADAYRAAGVEPPADELPDHLGVVLEFAATVDPKAGYALLAEHRTPVSMLHEQLVKAGSPYAAVVEAVSTTLPAAGPDDLREARRLTMAGPPVEQVGLDSPPVGGQPLPWPVAGTNAGGSR